MSAETLNVYNQGVNAAFLRDIVKKVREYCGEDEEQLRSLTTTVVCEEFLNTITEPYQCSYIEYMKTIQASEYV